MKFLVILLALLANYLWLKDFDRFDDGWFFRFRRRVESAFDVFDNESARAWIPAQLVIYTAPVITLFLLLTLVQGQAFGLPTLLLHLLVLLIALDRTQPTRLSRAFLERFADQSLEECRAWLEEELALAEHLRTSDRVSLGRYFRRQLASRCFERMFVMYFWYLLTGPIGVLFCYISYQLRDSHRADQPEDEVDFVKRVIAVLEWIPMRLLALTFSLAGNFERCFDRIKESFWSFRTGEESAEILYEYASCALTAKVEDIEAVSESGDPHAQQERQLQQEAKRIEALRSLLERCQAIWLALLALLTIFALP